MDELPNFGKLWDRKLYHGTNFKFNVGDLILPASRAGVQSNYDPRFIEGLESHAFGTTDINEAVRAAEFAVSTKGFGEINVNTISPILNSEEDLDYDPNSSRGIRSRSGFNVEGRLSSEAIENERALESTRNLVTNSMKDLRINQSGQAYFLHASFNEIKVGDKINTTSAQRLGRGMAGDALFGKSYGWDALNEGSILDAFNTHKSGFIYITQADASLVGPDLNVGAKDYQFIASNARIIKRRAGYLT